MCFQCDSGNVTISRLNGITVLGISAHARNRSLTGCPLGPALLPCHVFAGSYRAATVRERFPDGHSPRSVKHSVLTVPKPPVPSGCTFPSGNDTLKVPRIDLWALPARSISWFGLFKLLTLALLWHQGFLFPPSKNVRVQPHRLHHLYEVYFSDCRICGIIQINRRASRDIGGKKRWRMVPKSRFAFGPAGNRTLLACLALLPFNSLSAQDIMAPSGGLVRLMPSDAAILESTENRKDLPCTVTPDKAGPRLRSQVPPAATKSAFP